VKEQGGANKGNLEGRDPPNKKKRLKFNKTERENVANKKKIRSNNRKSTGRLVREEAKYLATQLKKFAGKETRYNGETLMA